jgi:hypothetical protein
MPAIQKPQLEYNILKKCKECKNTLKQITGNQYYCDSSPSNCSKSTKTITVK